MARRTKEAIYDAEVFPLMEQVIAICKKHRIAMLADFAVPNKSDPHLKCTTFLLDDEYKPGEEQLQAMRVLSPRSTSVTMITCTRADGTKDVTAVL